MAFRDIEREFALGELDVFKEFDSSHFISNAKAAITGKVQEVKFNHKINYYSSMLTKAIASFNAISFDREAFNNFIDRFESINKVGDFGFKMKDVEQIDVTAFKPQYLNQYIDMTKTMIDKMLNDSLEDIEASKYISGEYARKVKRQVVRTTLPENLRIKSYLALDLSDVDVDVTYVRTKVIPFVNGFNQLKQETLAEANSILNAIKETESNVDAMHKAIEKIKLSGEYSFEKVNQINKISYATLRGLIDIISYVTFMMIRKLTTISEKIVSCEKLFNFFTDVYSIESVIDNSLFPTDANSLASYLIKGKIDPFEDAASALANKYKNVNIGNYRRLENNSEQDQKINDYRPYRAIAKALLSISSGLDVISKEGGDYLVIFQDVLKESGLNISLDARFKYELTSISDMSEYNTSVVKDDFMKARIIDEIQSFPDNMKVISNISAEVYNKITYLLDRYNNTITEYADMEFIKELDLFIRGFEDQFRNFMSEVASRFYKRLKELELKVETIATPIRDADGSDHYNTTEFTNSVDRNDAFDDSEFSEKEESIKRYFESLERDFIKEREMIKRGVNIVFEAPAPAPQQKPGQAGAPAGPAPGSNEAIASAEAELDNAMNALNGGGGGNSSSGAPAGGGAASAPAPAPAGGDPAASGGAPAPAPASAGGDPAAGGMPPADPAMADPTAGAGAAPGGAPAADPNAAGGMPPADPTMADPTAGAMPEDPTAGAAPSDPAADPSLSDPNDPNATPPADSQAGATNNIRANVTEFEKDVLEKFKAVTSKSTAANTKWLNMNKTELVTRSYNNVTVNMLPYHNMKPGAELADIEKIKANINGLTPQNMKDITSKDEMYKRLFSFIPDISDSDGNAGKIIEKYYKVGNGDLELEPIANGNLKSEITTQIIPSVEEYNNGAWLSKFTAKADDLASTADARITNIVSTGASDEVVSAESASIPSWLLAYEDGEEVVDPNAAPAEPAEPSINEQIVWLKECIKMYIGSVLNVARDRQKDYLKVLSSLTTKTPATPEKNNEEEIQSPPEEEIPTEDEENPSADPNEVEDTSDMPSPEDVPEPEEMSNQEPEMSGPEEGNIEPNVKEDKKKKKKKK